MQTIIKNNTPAYLDTEIIQEQINTLKMDYMNSHLQILKVTTTQPLLTEDIIIYELLIWDSSEEPIKGTPENYMDGILDYIDYAKANDCNIEAKIKVISNKEKLSRITLTITF